MNDWKSWLHGLGAAIIGGGASVFVGFVSGASWTLTGKMAATAAVVNAAAYLKQSPLPAEKLTKTETTSTTVEVKKEN